VSSADGSIPAEWLEEFEAAARRPRDAVVVIPLGAAAKEHGPHLKHTP
jgi:hypothetical protein